MSIKDVALAGYRIANPMSGYFPDEATKKTWLTVAEVVLKYVPSVPISSKKFITEAEDTCTASYSDGAFQGKRKESIVALATLYHKLHVELSPEAYYMYACAAKCVCDGISSENKQLFEPLKKLLILPSEIVERIDALPRVNSKGEKTMYPGGYATLRVLSDIEYRIKHLESAWSRSRSYGCSMCRAHVSHFLCDGD